MTEFVHLTSVEGIHSFFRKEAIDHMTVQRLNDTAETPTGKEVLYHFRLTMRSGESHVLRNTASVTRSVLFDLGVPDENVDAVVRGRTP